MSPALLNQFWKVVETVPHSQLVSLSDQALVDRLSQPLVERHKLTSAEIEAVQSYIRSRLTLIRDMSLAS